MKGKKIIAGIDIGGTNTVLGFVDTDGNYISCESIPTQINSDAIKFAALLGEKIKHTYKDFEEGYTLEGIGIAAPNANFFTGIIEAPSNLKWRNVNFVKLMSAQFDVPVKLVNDANAAALGEMYFGKAKGMKNFIEITLGTGLGSGVVVDGNLLFGENGFAGEVGHIIVKENGRDCNCGRKGCLETYASATGICRTVAELLSSTNMASELRSIPFEKLNAHTIHKLAEKGDQLSLKAFEVTGEILGKALANIAVCFSPEAIILFGGLAEAGDILLNPVRRHFEINLINIHSGKIKILKSDLLGGKAAVVGAASLILKYGNNSE